MIFIFLYIPPLRFAFSHSYILQEGRWSQATQEYKKSIKRGARIGPVTDATWCRNVECKKTPKNPWRKRTQGERRFVAELNYISPFWFMLIMCQRLKRHALQRRVGSTRWYFFIWSFCRAKFYFHSSKMYAHLFSPYFSNEVYLMSSSRC